MDLPKTLDPNDGEKQAIAVAITLNSAVNDRRQLTFQTYLGRDEPIGLFHNTVDKLSKVIDRQEAVYRLADEKLRLLSDEMQLETTAGDLLKIPEEVDARWRASNKKGPSQKLPADTARESQLKTNVEALRRRIDERKKEVATLEARIADTG